MRRGERACWAAVVALLFGTIALLLRPAVPARAASRPRAVAGERISMDRLHAIGGVPLGWQMSVPPGDASAGRQTFVDLGCDACHAVSGAPAAAGEARPGPELSGMGGHHPPAYFAEAILNPDAVLIDAPGYIAADGRSTMPDYPEMTATQLADLVAYLASLKQPEGESCHDVSSSARAGALTPLERRDLPPAPARDGQRYFAQSFDVLPGRLAAFEAWFAAQGRPRFLEVAGLERVDTYVDASRPGGALTTVLSFRDEAALLNFLGDPASADLWREFDDFVGPHGHVSSDVPLVYRASSLSSPS